MARIEPQTGDCKFDPGAGHITDRRPPEP